MKNFYYSFLTVIVIILLYFTYEIIGPYLLTIILAIVLSTITYPIYNFILKLFKQKEGLAAITSCFLVILIIVIPLFLLVFVIVDQAVDTVNSIQNQIDSGAINWKTVTNFIKEKAPFLNVDEAKIKTEALKIIGKVEGQFENVVKWLIGGVEAILSNLFKFFILFFSMFFFYKDGKNFLKKLTHLSPLPKSYEDRIANKFIDVSKSIFIGVFFTAIIQGVVGGVGFAIVGISPFLWALFLAFASIIPVIGTAIIWLPVGFVMIATGDVGSGVFLMIWCLVASLIIENIIKPLLIKGKTDMHPLIIFFSFLGGIGAFGLIGVILGPIIISILILLIDIYEETYKKKLDALDKR